MDDMQQHTVSDHVNPSHLPPVPVPPVQYETALDAAEYLRCLDVTVAFEDVFALQPDVFDEPSKLISPTVDANGLAHWDELPDLPIPEAVSAAEHLDISDKSLSFLQDVCRSQPEVEVAQYVQQVKEASTSASTRGLKLELPILRTDHEIDMREYNRTIWLARGADISNHSLPLEPCDQENDEGLEFPEQTYKADGRIMKSVESEKMEISKENFMALMEHLKLDWTDEDREAMLLDQLNYQGLALREPLTPPISPILQTREPFVPDEAVCNIARSSDPSSRTSDDLKKAEERIFDDDNESWMSLSEIEELMSPHDAEAPRLISLEQQGSKMEDLKMEEPLLLLPAKADSAPITPDLTAIRESIASIHNEIGDFQGTSLSISPKDDADEALDKTLKDSAANLMMLIEQEKLDPLDATIRVDVPVLNFETPAPAWEELCGNALGMFDYIRRTFAVDYHGLRWSRKLVEESKMVWKIWTAEDPRLTIEEPIEDTGLLDSFLDRSSDDHPPSASVFVLKKPGLRILEQEVDEDDDLQPKSAELRQPLRDWTTILKKRKASGEDEGGKRNQILSKNSSLDSHHCSDGPLDSTGSILAFDEEGGATKMLDNYLELHAAKKRNLGSSRFFKKPEGQVPMKQPSQPAERGKTPGQQAAPQQLMPCPDIILPNKPPKLVISVTVHRSIITQLEHLLPGVQLIDRDYNAYNASVWLPGSVRRSETSSPIADDADLTISPSTGIILTTMLKVRQKPLPGAKGRSLLNTRIENISAKYERLVVLVSEDNKIDEGMNALSDSDAVALAGFQAFAAALSSETTVLYVGGGAVTSAKWVAAIAARHATETIVAQDYLVQDESHWELFLRRAGMNAYAAQVVLGMLRGPDEEPVIDQNRAYGLAALVKMPEMKRLEMFEGVLGGRRVLRRVGQILDANWGDVLGET